MKKKIFLLIIGLLICVGIYLIITQSYPIALVNWQPVNLKSFKKDYSAVIHYYQKALETYDKNQLAVLNSLEVQGEIKLALLNQLIENSLIRQELKKRIKSSEFEEMVTNKIDQALKQEDIQKEVETLYGLSLSEFQEIILRPQAEKEIMAGRLSLENNQPAGGFDEWLKEIKKQAKIIILLPNFKWNGNEVAIK